jgi:hypothetical protein
MSFLLAGNSIAASREGFHGGSLTDWSVSDYRIARGLPGVKGASTNELLVSTGRRVEHKWQPYVKSSAGQDSDGLDVFPGESCRVTYTMSIVG